MRYYSEISLAVMAWHRQPGCKSLRGAIGGLRDSVQSWLATFDVTRPAPTFNTVLTIRKAAWSHLRLLLSSPAGSLNANDQSVFRSEMNVSVPLHAT